MKRQLFICAKLKNRSVNLVIYFLNVIKAQRGYNGEKKPKNWKKNIIFGIELLQSSNF